MAVQHQIFADYFSRIYPKVETGDKIQAEREKLNYREVSKNAKVIDNEGIGVIVRFGNAENIIKKIRGKNSRTEKVLFGRDDMRSLQRFMVNLYQRDFDILQQKEQLEPLLEGKNLDLFVVNIGSYHKKLGVLINNRPTNEFYDCE